MKNRDAVKPSRAPAWALLLLYFALAAAALALLHSYTETDAQSIMLTPYLQDDRGWDIYCLDENGGKVALTPSQTSGHAGLLYLSRVLDPAYEQAGYTTLDLSGPVSVFLDGALLYTTAPGTGDTPEASTLPEGYRVPVAGGGPRLNLPTGYGGKTLTLVFNRGAQVLGTPSVLLTSHAVETARITTTANGIAMPAAVYMATALLLLGLLFYGGFQGRWDWPMLLLALSAVFQSLYQLRDFSTFLNFNAALDVRAAALIPALFVALPLCYLLCQMTGRRRLHTVLVLLPAAIALLPGIYNLFPPSPAGNWVWHCGQALYFSIAVMLVCAVEQARAGNRTFRLFLAGLGLLLGALAAACMVSPAVAKNVGSVFLQAVDGLYTLPLYWCGTVLFILCSILSVSNGIQSAAEAKTLAELLTAQVSALEGRVAATKAAEEAIRIERHDLRHRLQIVTDMVERGEKEQALDFLGAAQTRLEELKLVRWCQNPVLDAVFASYFEQAKRLHIDVEATLAVPDTLPVQAAELSTVFANALENAIHACAALPQGERKIVCKCLSHPGLMFEVANTYAGEVRFDANGLPVSHQQGHGIGTRSIAAFCKKHGAACFYSAKDGWFRMRVIL